MAAALRHADAPGEHRVVDLAAYPREAVESYHLQIEAMKLAFVDAQRYVADPDHADVPTAALLDKQYDAAR